MLRKRLRKSVVMGALALPLALGGSFADAAPKQASKRRASVTKPLKLHKVTWHADLGQAITLASPARKPIVWLRVLGDLAGKT